MLYFVGKSLKIKLIFSVSEEFENKNFFAEYVFFRIFLNTFWVSLTHHCTEVAHQPGSFKGIVWKVGTRSFWVFKFEWKTNDNLTPKWVESHMELLQKYMHKSFTTWNFRMVEKISVILVEISVFKGEIVVKVVWLGIWEESASGWNFFGIEIFQLELDKKNPEIQDISEIKIRI